MSILAQNILQHDLARGLLLDRKVCVRQRVEIPEHGIGPRDAQRPPIWVFGGAIEANFDRGVRRDPAPGASRHARPSSIWQLAEGGGHQHLSARCHYGHPVLLQEPPILPAVFRGVGLKMQQQGDHPQGQGGDHGLRNEPTCFELRRGLSIRCRDAHPL